MSNKIAAYIENHSQDNGFKSKTGYKYYVGSRILEITPYFGGSMNIMKLYSDDFPHEMPDESLAFDRETCGKLNDKYPVRWDDHEVYEKFKSRGRTFRYLPFHTTIYVLGTNENISSNDPKLISQQNKVQKRDRIHFGVLLRKINIFNKRIITKRIKKEFNIH